MTTTPRLLWTIAAVLAGTAASILTASSTSAADLAATRLRCEYLETPQGIGAGNPRLSWVVTSSQRNEQQTAYQILVASSESLLQQNQGDLWDSGKVFSRQSVHVEYQGRPLDSGTACYWKVRLWGTKTAESQWSQPANWTMGLLKEQDWQAAAWIGEESRAWGAASEGYSWIWSSEDSPHAMAQPAERYFRRQFTVPTDRQLASAVMHITCDNGFVLFVNGKEASRSDDWTKPIAVDISSQLQTGANTLAIHATNINSATGLIGKLTLQFADGEPVVIPFDQQFKVFKQEVAGWNQIEFDDSAWPAAQALGPMGIAPWGVIRWPGNEPQFTLPPAPYLRHTFAITKPIRRATAYATALGCYELHLNGTKVGNDYFTPGWPEFRKRVYHQTYDVTSLLKTGDNAIGAILTDGWYSGYIWAGRDTYGTVPKLRALLRIEYEDGTLEDIGTDGSWQLAYGPIREGDVQQGETYDARREMPGWDAPGFDESNWQPVTVAKEIAIPIGVSPCPPVRTQGELVPVRMTEPKPGVYIFDLGQNIAGWVRIKCRGPAGTKITLRHSGMLNPDGTLYTDYLREARAIDAYYLKGTDEETWEPSTTYHGFQYVEVTGYPGAPSLDSVRGIVCHSDLDVVGTFECSDPRVNKLYSNIVWTLRDNLVDLPTGCADRAERLGWCDHNLLFRTECYIIDVAPMIAKWMTDVQDSQTLSANGSFLQCAPIWGDQESPGWSDVGITGVYYMYKAYGDRRIIEEHYDSMARYIEHIRSDLKDYLRPFPYKFADGRTFTGYGDWLSIVFDMQHNEVLNNIFNGRTVGMMAEMAEAVGRTDDAARYRDLFENMKRSFNAAYVTADGQIRDKTQAQYALALDAGYYVPEKAALAVEHLAKDITENSHQQTFADALGKNPVIPPGHLTTGFHGSRALLPALSRYGRNDVAYALLLQDTYPSWLYNVKNGATTIWERWDSWTPDRGFQNPAMNSFNMPNIGASIGEWLFACVGGIDTVGAGFETIRIAPQPGDGLTYASATYHSIRGLIAVRWEKTSNGLVLDVHIPSNCYAIVDVPIPHTNSQSITEGDTLIWNQGRQINPVEGIGSVQLVGAHVEIKIGGGTYRFRITDQQ